jgi:hypothetical protein
MNSNVIEIVCDVVEKTINNHCMRMKGSTSGHPLLSMATVFTYDIREDGYALGNRLKVVFKSVNIVDMTYYSKPSLVVVTTNLGDIVAEISSTGEGFLVNRDNIHISTGELIHHLETLNESSIPSLNKRIKRILGLDRGLTDDELVQIVSLMKSENSKMRDTLTRVKSITSGF